MQLIVQYVDIPNEVFKLSFKATEHLSMCACVLIYNFLYACSVVGVSGTLSSDSIPVLSAASPSNTDPTVFIGKSSICIRVSKQVRSCLYQNKNDLQSHHGTASSLVSWLTFFLMSVASPG